MRILVTNDDGYTAPGLTVLANRLLLDGHEVTVAAPLRQQSGGSASLGRVSDGALVDWQEFISDEIPGVSVIAIDAPPALAVKAILGGALGDRPDLVLSGINAGWNTGGSILHSGTLGAALTARSLGWRAAAISCGKGAAGKLHTAAAVASSVVRFLERFDSPVALNVNVPNLEVEELKGVRRTIVAGQGLLDVEVVRARNELRLRLIPKLPERDATQDSQAVLDGYVSVSVLNARYAELDLDEIAGGYELESMISSGVSK
ncbi:MAG TPA: 5'/3'-nucleotidase SurE [Terrimesophilobacter sp.]|nr:5'/3'-nucleotidase SurE [Terrimesophilobacter sp.]